MHLKNKIGRWEMGDGSWEMEVGRWKMEELKNS
jgi:hypothetical protein